MQFRRAYTLGGGALPPPPGSYASEWIDDDDAQIEVFCKRAQTWGFWRYAPPGNCTIYRPSELNSDGFHFYFAKSIIAKQFEDSRIKRMCIFHVLTVRGLPRSEGASTLCMRLPVSRYILTPQYFFRSVNLS